MLTTWAKKKLTQSHKDAEKTERITDTVQNHGSEVFAGMTDQVLYIDAPDHSPALSP